MPFSTYDELQTSILSWLARPGDPLVSPAVPDMIQLFEREATRRLKVGGAEKRASLTALSAAVALPADFGELRLATSGGVVLTYVTPMQLPDGGGPPAHYTIIGNEMRLGPSPTGGCTIEIVYQSGVPPLSDANPSNWLLAAHPDCYLFGSLVEAESFIGSDDRIPLWAQRREAAFSSIESADRKARWGGAPLSIRAEGVSGGNGTAAGDWTSAPPVPIPITGIVAGDGLSGGGSEGIVTIALDTPVSVANGGTGNTFFATDYILTGGGPGVQASPAIVTLAGDVVAASYTANGAGTLGAFWWNGATGENWAWYGIAGKAYLGRFADASLTPINNDLQIDWATGAVTAPGDFSAGSVSADGLGTAGGFWWAGTASEGYSWHATAGVAHLQRWAPGSVSMGDALTVDYATGKVTAPGDLFAASVSANGLGIAGGFWWAGTASESWSWHATAGAAHLGRWALGETSVGDALMINYTTGVVDLPNGATAPTPAPGDNDTSLATTAFVQAALAAGGSGINQLTGDVTAGPGSGSQAALIAANAVTTAKILNANVTYGKIQNITAARLIGNPTGSAAAPSEISLGTNLSFAGTVLNAAGTSALSGMVAGQIPIAATATSITSSGNLSGAITTSGSLATTLANNAVATAHITNANVTYAKIQNVAANRLLGNATGSAAAPSEIALPLALANGGTGSITAAAALTALGAVAKAGDTMTGGLSITPASGSANLTLGKSAGANLNVIQGNVASAPRWQAYVGNNATESGSDTGSNFDIYRFADGGAAAVALTINRATGACSNTSGTWTAISDRELKQEIAPYRRGLDAVLALNPIEFRYRAGTPFATEDAPSRVLYGLVADEVMPHVPEVVGTITARVDGKEREVDTLEPGNLIYALINAVKELSAKVAALEGKPG